MQRMSGSRPTVECCVVRPTSWIMSASGLLPADPDRCSESSLCRHCYSRSVTELPRSTFGHTQRVQFPGRHVGSAIHVKSLGIRRPAETYRKNKIVRPSISDFVQRFMHACGPNKASGDVRSLLFVRYAKCEGMKTHDSIRGFRTGPL